MNLSPSRLPLWITEDITWSILWGLLAIAILTVIWIGTRQYRFLTLAGVVAALLTLLLIVEATIITDKEYLINAVYEMADHVRNNNADGIVQFVRDDNKVFAERIRRNMAQYDFRSCNLIGFSETTVEPEGSNPRTAKIGFSVWASGAPAGRLDLFQSAGVAVNLEFEKNDGHWTIEAYGYRPSNSPHPIVMFRD